MSFKPGDKVILVESRIEGKCVPAVIFKKFGHHLYRVQIEKDHQTFYVFADEKHMVHADVYESKLWRVLA